MSNEILTSTLGLIYPGNGRGNSRHGTEKMKRGRGNVPDFTSALLLAHLVVKQGEGKPSIPLARPDKAAPAVSC